MARILILGGRGRLGAAIARAWSKDEKHEVTSLARPEVDISDLLSLQTLLEETSFDWLVNGTAMTNVDLCESEHHNAEIANSQAPALMAAAAAEKNARMIHFSTDYVFDGKKTDPYVELDPALPLSWYGVTKLRGEQNVIVASPRHIVARVSWVFGPDKPSFIDMLLERARTQDRVEAIADKTSCPTYSEDVATSLAPVLERDLPGGLYHLCNAGACTWQEYGQAALDLAAAAGITLKTTQVEALKLSDMKQFVAARPPHTAMATDKWEKTTGRKQRPWKDALTEYISSHHAH